MNKYENENLFKLKLDPNKKHKDYYEKYNIRQDSWSVMMKKGVSLNTVIRYELFDLIDYNKLPDWYYKLRANHDMHCINRNKKFMKEGKYE